MNPCPHSSLEYIGMQDIIGEKPVRLYDCRKCHTTVARHRYYRTETELRKLNAEIELLRVYLLEEKNPDTPEKNLESLEALINTVSRAKSILSNAILRRPLTETRLK